MICQSGAIARFAAKLNGLYPSDPRKALNVDEMYDSVEALYSVPRDHSIPDEERALKREAWAGADLATFHKFFKLRVDPHSPYIANGEFSLADIDIYVIFYKLLPSKFVGFSEKKLREAAPAVYEYLDKLVHTPEMKKILEKASLHPYSF